MKKKTLIGLIILVVIGGAWYMKREKDLAELHDIQTDLANYLYNNYRLYTVDKDKDEQLNAEYNKGEGSLTTEEFLKKSVELNEYSDIEKIEFTGFSVSPMNFLVVSFTINDVYSDDTTLSTVSAETNTWIYSLDTGNTRNNYVLDEKEVSTNSSIPEKAIIYYEGGIK